ncbi:MAG: LTA synthase family protein [Erysipelotrichaceae bacterium]|nr:LTA synthase family protein [Erysipelotrichaceae bacterium]
MRKLKPVLFFLLLFISLASISGVIYAFSNFAFETNPLEQIIFHIMVPTYGTGSAFVKGILVQCVILPFAVAFFLVYVIYNKTSYFEFSILDRYNFRPFLYLKKHRFLLASMFCVISLAICLYRIGFFGYIDNLTKSTTLYEDEYVDPSQIEFTFPEKKRNLIYIFLESVETSDYSYDEGGAFPENYIPELYQLAQDNITFNDNQGYYVLSDTGWTVAAMIAHTSGINLSIPIDGNSYISDSRFLVGAYSIGEILEKEGYTNELLIGSDASFGGRRDYFTQHGHYLIHDYNWSVDTGLIDYYEWWGFEDFKLFEFAKNDLLELAEKDEPFNLTLLTVDSHHMGGYTCKLCRDDYDIYSLANVFACTSRQTCEFVEWVQQQDFYENTTIIIVGDHCSMDTTWGGKMPEDYQRKVYYTIINPAEGCVPTQDRKLNTADFYPTTVASLGITWKGDRLGLGTNLFSETETLVEKYGLEELNRLASKHSRYYEKHILYGE